MHKMAFAHVFGPEKKNGFGPFSYKFFVCIRVGLSKHFPNRTLFQFLWEQNLVQKSSKIFPTKLVTPFMGTKSCTEIFRDFQMAGNVPSCQILAQDFQMAAVTKILKQQDKSFALLLSTGNHKTLQTQTTHTAWTTVTAMQR